MSFVALGLLAVYAHSLEFAQSATDGKSGFLKYSIDGPTKLGDGELYVDSKVKVNLTSQGSYYKMAIGSASGSTYDVQLLFRVPREVLATLTRRVQVDFSVRADQELQGILKADIAKPPYTNLGLAEKFAVGTDWKAYSFQFSVDPNGQLLDMDTADQEIFCPAFHFPSFRGNIEVRRVFLRNLAPTLGEIPTVAAPKTEAQAFQWLAGLPKSFADRDLGKIVGAWSPDYSIISVEDAGKRVKVGRDVAVKTWAAQISYSGMYADANGPGTVLIESVVSNGPKMTMKGYWDGSWRDGDWTNLRDGGISFGSRFTANWTMSPAGWQLSSFVEGPYVELTDAATQKLKTAHAKLVKKYGG